MKAKFFTVWLTIIGFIALFVISFSASAQNPKKIKGQIYALPTTGFGNDTLQCYIIQNKKLAAGNSGFVAIQGTGAGGTDTLWFYQDASGNIVIDGTGTGKIKLAETTWIPAGEYLGIGHNAPASAIDIRGTNGAKSSAVYIRASNDSKRPNQTLVKSRGTLTVPITVNLGDTLGGLNYRGYDGADADTNNAVIVAIVTEPSGFSAGKHGTSIIFRVTENGSAQTTDALKLDQDKSATFYDSVYVTDDLRVKVNGIIDGKLGINMGTSTILNAFQTLGTTTANNGWVNTMSSNNTTGGGIAFWKTRGTYAIPLVVNTSDDLGGIYFYGYDLGTPDTNSVNFKINATQNHGKGSHGGSLKISTTPNTYKANSVTALFIDQDQSATFYDSVYVTDDLRVKVNGLIDGKLGVGTTSPGANIHSTGTTNATSSILSQRTSNDALSPTIATLKARGTGVSAIVQSGDTLGTYKIMGFNASNSTKSGAIIFGKATETWSGTASGASLAFQTVPNTTLTKTTALLLGQDQSATFYGTVKLNSVIAGTSDTLLLREGFNVKYKLDTSFVHTTGAEIKYGTLQITGALNPSGGITGYTGTGLDANYWNVAGNSGVNKKFGLTSNNSFYFYTNNTRRAKLDSLGNFGLNSTNPLHKLVAVGSNATNVNMLNLVNSDKNINRTTLAQARDTSSFNVFFTPLGKPVFNIMSATGSYIQGVDSTGKVGIGLTPISSWGKVQILTSDYKSFTLADNITNNTAKAGMIMGAPYTNANSCWTGFGTYDDNTHHGIYIGGGGWGTPDANRITFYTATAYNQTNNAGIARMIIGPNGNIGFGNGSLVAGIGGIYNLSFNGDAAYTLGSIRSTTAGSGNNLSIYSGATKSGNTNQNGSILYLYSGVGTGTGISSVRASFNTRYPWGTATKTSDNIPYDAIMVASESPLIDNTNDTLFTLTPINSVIPLADTVVSFALNYGVTATDATDIQSETGVMLGCGVVKTGAATVSFINSTSTQAVSAGTLGSVLTLTWNNSTKKFYAIVKYDSSLNPGAGLMRITYTMYNHSRCTVTQL